jgi:capsular polysaccharide biosynthesis protein
LELRRYLRLIRLRAWIVVLTVVAGLAAAYLITPRIPVYQSSTTIYVGSKSIPFNSGILSQEQAGLAQISYTFAAMVSSQPIAEKALTTSHIDRSIKRAVAETKAMVLPTTNLIRVTVSDTDRTVARDLADAMSDSFVQEIQTFEAPTPPTTGVKPGQPAYVFERANLPSHKLPNALIRNLNLGWIFGLVLSVAAILLLDYLDITAKGPDELERRIGLPVLGVVPLQRQLIGGLSPIATPRRSVFSARSNA